MTVQRMAKWIAGGFALAAALATGSSSLAAYPGVNGRIAFYRADGYMYSIKSDGTGLSKIGPGAAPSYSPDGKRIAFQWKGDIWTANADGSNRRRVTRLASDERDPTWSPNGTKLAFASDRNGGGIFSLRSTVPYGTLTRLVRTPTPTDDFSWSDYAPAWATNGLIYFTRSTADYVGFCQDREDTMSVNPSTRVVALWGSFDFGTESADPAPRARAMVFAKKWGDGVCDFGDGISIANIDGSNPRTVTPLRINTAPIDTEPVFSPDATKVAFQRGRYVYTVNADGTAIHRLAVGSAPSWQRIPTS